MYEERTYRNLVKTDDLVNFEVIVKETDLLVRAERDLFNETRESILKYRYQLETYIAMHPEFIKSLIPGLLSSFFPHHAWITNTDSEGDSQSFCFAFIHF